MSSAPSNAHIITSRHRPPPHGRARLRPRRRDHRRRVQGYRGTLILRPLEITAIRLAYAMGRGPEAPPRHRPRPHPGFLRSRRCSIASASPRPTGATRSRRTSTSRVRDPRYVGRAVAALASDPNVHEKAGPRPFSSWPLAKEYGFTDVDGRQPDWTPTSAARSPSSWTAPAARFPRAVSPGGALLPDPPRPSRRRRRGGSRAGGSARRCRLLSPPDDVMRRALGVRAIAPPEGGKGAGSSSPAPGSSPREPRRAGDRRAGRPPPPSRSGATAPRPSSCASPATHARAPELLAIGGLSLLRHAASSRRTGSGTRGGAEWFARGAGRVLTCRSKRSPSIGIRVRSRSSRPRPEPGGRDLSGLRLRSEPRSPGGKCGRGRDCGRSLSIEEERMNRRHPETVRRARELPRPVLRGERPRRDGVGDDVLKPSPSWARVPRARPTRRMGRRRSYVVLEGGAELHAGGRAGPLGPGCLRAASVAGGSAKSFQEAAALRSAHRISLNTSLQHDVDLSCPSFAWSCSGYPAQLGGSLQDVSSPTPSRRGLSPRRGTGRGSSRARRTVSG